MAKPRVDLIPGGKGDRARISDFDPVEVRKGIEVEMEHTSNPNIALEIALDHLSEDPHYYRKLAKIHKERTSDTALDQRLDRLSKAAMKHSRLAFSAERKDHKIKHNRNAAMFHRAVIKLSAAMGRHPASVIHHKIHHDHHTATLADLEGGGSGFKPDRSDDDASTDDASTKESVDASLSWLEGLYGYLLSESRAGLFNDLVYECRLELDEGIADTVKKLLSFGRSPQPDRSERLSPQERAHRAATAEYLKKRTEYDPADPAHEITRKSKQNAVLLKTLRAKHTKRAGA